jgi:hypothetical protein
MTHGPWWVGRRLCVSRSDHAAPPPSPGPVDGSGRTAHDGDHRDLIGLCERPLSARAVATTGGRA